MTTRNRLAEAPMARRGPEEICNDENSRRLADPEGRRDVHWYVHEGRVCIGWVRQLGTGNPQQPGHIMERDRSGFTAHDWRQLNLYLESAGSSVRYRDDGTRMEVVDG